MTGHNPVHGMTMTRRAVQPATAPTPACRATALVVTLGACDPISQGLRQLLLQHELTNRSTRAPTGYCARVGTRTATGTESEEPRTHQGGVPITQFVNC